MEINDDGQEYMQNKLVIDTPQLPQNFHYAILSPNNQFLYIMIHIYDVEKNILLRKLPNNILGYIQPVFSFDSKILALIDQQKQILMQFVECNTLVKKLMPEKIYSISFNSNNYKIIVSLENLIQIYELSICQGEINKDQSTYEILLIKQLQINFQNKPHICRFSSFISRFYTILQNQFIIQNFENIKKIKQIKVKESIEQVEESVSKNIIIVSSSYSSVYVLQLDGLKVLIILNHGSLINFFGNDKKMNLLFSYSYKNLDNSMFWCCQMIQILPERKVLLKNKKITKKYAARFYPQNQRMLIVYYPKQKKCQLLKIMDFF